MAQHVERNPLEAAYAALLANGLDGAGEALRILVNEASRIEREHFLNARPHERTRERTDYANGFKPKTVMTRLGQQTFDIPQVRGGPSFYPSALDKGVRSEQALKLALAEMYVQGVSTRKVAAIVERLCGTSVSSTQVSRCASQLDAELDAWRTRPLGLYPYLLLDARYEKVREGGRVIDCAVLIAVGIDQSGKRSILGVSAALSEAEVHWRTFFTSLQKRGLQGVKLVVSDDHAGLGAARKALFPSVPWRRCQFHLQQNAQAYVPRLDQRAAVAHAIHSIFNSPDLHSAQRRLKEVVDENTAARPKLAAWMEENLPQGFTVFSFPMAHQRRLRTTNALERLNMELKRRTRVAGLFPNEASLLRLVSALLVEFSEEWETGRIYLSMDSQTQPSV